MPAAQELKPTRTGKIAFPKIEKGKRNTPYCPLLAANPGRSRKLAARSSANGLFPSFPNFPCGNVVELHKPLLRNDLCRIRKPRFLPNSRKGKRFLTLNLEL